MQKTSSGGFYRRINSLVIFGLIEQVSKGRLRITQLAKNILFPLDNEQRNQGYVEAFFHVEIWTRLYEKVKRNPPPSIFAQLSSITDAEPLEIKKLEGEIKRFYLEDLSLISDEALEQKDQKSYSLDQTHNKQFMDQQPIFEQPTELDRAFGTISISDRETLIVKDEDTLVAGEAFFNIIRKRVEKSKKEEDQLSKTRVECTHDVKLSPDS